LVTRTEATKTEKEGRSKKKEILRSGDGRKERIGI